ncbi:adenosine deaminase [Capronia coronata CBS 617.96]|uniref:adenosine deaminase n=1 Tax=Capronia coronata CBS 617.96 TaxID=1182541 RepID=W9YPC7_9EURO|nr:adenosine deaminase [Capronia coronata CBS 617.96]EXJ91096.1 adenosine deaminase [Capronia coronata CBS 617.96]
MAPKQESSDEGSIDPQLEWELEAGIPQVDDPFIQKYYAGRQALIAQEKKKRHDRLFKQTMTPIAKQAAKIMASIRRRELKTVWTSEFEESLMDKNGGNLYPGMMFTLARDRIETTELWKIIERMPKGALLHAHLDAMIDIDWLVDQALAEKGFCILAPEALSDRAKRTTGLMQFRFYPDEEINKQKKPANIWSADYTPNTPVPMREAQRSFPDDDTTFKKWLISRCTITAEESLCHHHGLDAIWRKFTSAFSVIGGLLYYEPFFRRALSRLFGQLASDGITYVDLRAAFMFEYRPQGQTHGQVGQFDEFFTAFDEEIEKFKKTDAGKNFTGARMIWTVFRRLDNRAIAAAMTECIRIKKKFPHLVCGFDLVGQEDKGRTLKDLTPMLFWFRKQCAEAGVDLPFFFHSGECLGDGDSTDENLFDAILLGTRRIGHGYSLYKHPLLIDMVKEKKILVETCPISNEILRLCSSILTHAVPALLSRGVSVSLNNDDPAILGHGKNGLSHDFWQAYMAFENLGLEGLGTMAENSLKWMAIEDQKPAEWTRTITEGYMGKGIKAKLLREWRTEFEKWCQSIVMEYPLELDSDEEDEDEAEESDDEEEDE